MIRPMREDDDEDALRTLIITNLSDNWEKQAIAYVRLLRMKHGAQLVFLLVTALVFMLLKLMVPLSLLPTLVLSCLVSFVLVSCIARVRLAEWRKQFLKKNTADDMAQLFRFYNRAPNIRKHLGSNTTDDTNRRSIMFVAVVKEHSSSSSSKEIVVGSVAVQENADNNDAKLRRMSVGGNYQGRGVGSRLLSHLLNFCSARGYDALELSTGELNFAARRLYEGANLKRIGQRPLADVWRELKYVGVPFHQRGVMQFEYRVPLRPAAAAQ